MRRKALLGTIVGLMLGTMIAFGPNASAGSVTWYSGHVSPGHAVLFSINGKGDNQTFSPVFIQFTDTCKVSGDVFEAEFDFSGFAEPVTDGKFDLDFSDPLFETFRWTGKVGPTSASGHLKDAFPLFDGSGGLQVCSSGDEVWHAKGLVSPRVAPAASGRVVVTVTRHPDGSITTQVQR
jgi:hypothetical protein